MICLTGDLHHMTLQTGNQQHCDMTEMQTGQLFLKMLEEAQVKVTFFISGKCFAEEWQDTQSVCESKFVEIGGHNYSCFTPVIVHRVWNKLVRSYNGPLWYQKQDAKKTMNIIKKKTGHTIQCWRNHMYMHGPFTEKALWQSGIKICSDGVKKDSNGPVLHSSGIYNFPLNVMPDHEHLFHAERTPEYVEWFQKRYNWSDDYGPDSYYIEEWTERVLDELKAHERDGIISNMIIHPITMYLCDKFVCFRKILDFISRCETVFMSEILEQQIQKSGEKQ